jgi:hypothetical protein
LFSLASDLDEIQEVGGVNEEPALEAALGTAGRFLRV